MDDTLHLLLDRIETGLCLIMEHLNGASMSDDRLDSCIIRCERMLKEIGDAETLNPDTSLSALYASIEFLIVTLHESGTKRIHNFTKKTSSSSTFGYWSEPVKVSCAVWISYNGDFRAISLFSEDHPATLA